MHTAAQTTVPNNHPPAVANTGSAGTGGEASAPAAENAFRFHSMLSRAETIRQFKTAIAAAIKQLGLETFQFVAVGAENPQPLSNWGGALTEAYGDSLECDLVALHAQKNQSPVYLSAIASYVEQSPFYVESHIQFLDLCKRLEQCGYLDSYNIPYATPMGINCLFSVSNLDVPPAEFQQIISACQPTLYLLGDILANMAISRHAAYFFGRKAFRRDNHVTPKQLQLLEKLAKNNVTLQGAADAMCISLDTANKHIAAIKATLGAKTQATAVYRAIVSGLIELDGRAWD